MIFKDTWEKVLDETKTQTRRIVKDDEYTWTDPLGNITEVVGKHHRLKWQVGKNYAIQSGRGKKSLGRIKLKKINMENLQHISDRDAKKEGVRKLYRCPQWITHEATLSFKQLWDGIHKKSGDRWEDNPEVWVLEFELID